MRSIETVGAGCSEPERIGLALVHQALSADLREMLDAVQRSGEVAEAGEEFGGGPGVAGDVDACVARIEQHACDLTGALCDDALEAGLVVDEDRLDMGAVGVVAIEQRDLGCIADGGGEMDHMLAQGKCVHAHRIVRVEPAQDDPDQLHGCEYIRPRTPADLRALHPTNFRA